MKRITQRFFSLIFLLSVTCISIYSIDKKVNREGEQEIEDAAFKPGTIRNDREYRHNQEEIKNLTLDMQKRSQYVNDSINKFRKNASDLFESGFAAYQTSCASDLCESEQLKMVIAAFVYKHVINPAEEANKRNRIDTASIENIKKASNKYIEDREKAFFDLTRFMKKIAIFAPKNTSIDGRWIAADEMVRNNHEMNEKSQAGLADIRELVNDLQRIYGIDVVDIQLSHIDSAIKQFCDLPWKNIQKELSTLKDKRGVIDNKATRKGIDKNITISDQDSRYYIDYLEQISTVYNYVKVIIIEKVVAVQDGAEELQELLEEKNIDEILHIVKKEKLLTPPALYQENDNDDSNDDDDNEQE